MDVDNEIELVRPSNFPTVLSVPFVVTAPVLPAQYSGNPQGVLTFCVSTRTHKAVTTTTSTCPKLVRLNTAGRNRAHLSIK